MLFDKLAGFIEKNTPEYVEMIEKTRLFQFPQYPEQVLPWGDQPITQEMADTFFLPFEVVGVEDNAGLVVMCDRESKQIGMSGWRDFIDAHPTRPKNMKPKDLLGQEGINTLELAEEAFDQIGGWINISFGSIQVTGVREEDCSLDVQVKLRRFVIFNSNNRKSEIIRDLGDSQDWPSNFNPRSALRNAKICLEEVLFFNQPHRFILESSAAKPRKTKQGRVTRSHDRPSYTILTPEEIRNKLKISGNPKTGSPKRSHERRRHFRTLNHPRFKNKLGETIIIEASWIGPNEATIGNKRYKVILDR